MDILEQIGDYEVLASNSVLIFGNEPVTLSIMENGKGLPFNIRFVEDESKEKKLSQRIENNAMILEFFNINSAGSFGLPQPVDVAKTDEGKEVIYFCCFITTFDVKGGHRLLNYAFYKKN